MGPTSFTSIPPPPTLQSPAPRVPDKQKSGSFVNIQPNQSLDQLKLNSFECEEEVPIMAKVLARDVDEELSLFLEMRRRDKIQQGVSSLPEPGTKSIDETTTNNLVSATTRCVQLRKSAVEKFLDSENNKSDYDWLLAAPETLGLREQQIRLTGTKSIDETTTKSLVSTTTTCVQLRQSAVEKFLDSENNKPDYEWLLAAPETLGEKEAQENSTVKLKKTKARSTALKPRVENIPQETVTRSVKASKQIPRLNTSTAVSKQANTVAEPKANSKPSRQATPTSRTTLPSTRQTNSAQNSNPDSRTSSIKSNPRTATLTRSSSVGKSVPSAAKSTSLTIRDIPARPVSASRGRAGGRSTGRSSKVSDDVNPVLMGTQMVERVVNMRKLPPPKHEDNMNSGFGRTLSRSSLDMAMRHMNIRRSVSGNLRVTSNALTNSMDKIESLPSS